VDDLRLVTEDDASIDLDDRFERLYRGHFSAVYAYFLRRVDATDVPDLVSDVFTVAWRRIEEVPAAPEDRPWLYGVAHKVRAQHGRGSQRREALLGRLRLNVGLQPPRVEEQHLDAQVQALLARLKPEDRELVRLVAWERLSHAEVGVVLGCSANAVAIRWHRSLARLRRDLGIVDDVPTVQAEGLS
jgi:RNA polymerase sigma-70 factor (ECF subfamily)